MNHEPEQWDGVLVETKAEMYARDYGPATQLACAKCRGREFHIGSGEYLTVVRCVKCGGAPYPVHTG